MMILKVAAAAAAVVLVAGLWLRGEHYAGRARTGEALLGSALAIGNANADVAESQAHLSKRIDAAAAVNALKKRDLRARSESRRKEIDDAPVEADGPLAPVLRDQLDRLPERPGADTPRDFAASGHPVIPPAAD